MVLFFRIQNYYNESQKLSEASASSIPQNIYLCTFEVVTSTLWKMETLISLICCRRVQCKAVFRLSPKCCKMTFQSKYLKSTLGISPSRNSANNVKTSGNVLRRHETTSCLKWLVLNNPPC